MIFNVNNKFYYITVALITFILKAIGDILFFSFKFNDSFYYYLWQALSFGILAFAIFITIYPVKIHTSEIDDTEFLNDTTKTLIVLILLLVLNFSLPDGKYNLSIGEIVFANFIALINLVIMLYIFSYSIKWHNINRHRKTSLYNSRLMVIFPAIYLLDCTNYFLFDNNSSIIKAIIVVLLIYIMISSFFNAKKLSWISVLERKYKVWISLATFLVSILGIIVWVNASGDSSIYEIFYKYSVGFPVLISAIFCFYLGFIFKIFSSTIITIPTSTIVDKRIYEINSLAYISKLIANTQNFDKILDSVTNLAINTSQAHSGWIEIYDDENMNIVSFQNFTQQQIEIISNEKLHHLFKRFKNPTIIQDIVKHTEIQSKISKVGWYQSIIIIPIQKDTHRYGSLILLNSDKYGFDYSDLKVLTAFSENINIAFENAKLLEESFEKERLKKELAIARNIQQNLLPKYSPKDNTYSIEFFSQPAEEVGGDYYDIFESDDKIIIIIGDVSGKGMNAAFLMAQLKGTVLAIIDNIDSPTEFLQKINSSLYKKIDKSMFITINCIFLDKKTNTISFARAGHLPILYKNSIKSIYLQPIGIGIGLVNNIIFESNIEEVKLYFEKNALIFLFTDGISELMNKSGIEFGFDKIRQMINSNDYQEPSMLIELFKTELIAHLGENIQSDDMTMIVIKRNK